MAFEGFSADVDAILLELAGSKGTVDVTVGSVTTKGIPATSDIELMQGRGSKVLGELIAVKIRTGSLPALALDGAITVDGQNLVVRNMQRIGHGVLSLIECSER